MKKIELSGQFEAYGLNCTNLFPIEEFPIPTPFGSMVCRLAAGESSTPHNHHEFEIFRVIEGRGTVSSGNKNLDVEAGDIVFLDAFKDHFVTNRSHLDELVFEAIWWENLAKLPKSDRKLLKKHLITATPPTPNGDLHVGHMSGPFLAADIYKRFLAMNDSQGYYLTGVDTNQTYVELKGVHTDTCPYEVNMGFGEKIYQTLSKAGITPDGYYRPRKVGHYNQQVQSFFLALLERGELVLKESDALFCPDTGNYLHEAWVSGQCSHCGFGSDGNSCEQCGRPNSVTDLINPKVKLTGKTPKLCKASQYVFPLSKFEDRLREYYQKVEMTPHISALVHNMLQDGLPEIPITHQTQWGVPVPVEGFENQIIYVWAEMIIGYLIGTAQIFDGSDQARPYDQWVDEGTGITQFFGFDNSWYHAVLFPALLMALTDKPKLADKFVTNEFLLLDGTKFSTSRNNLIWARDLLEQRDTSAVRLFLSLVRPENSQTNFKCKSFDTWYSETLQGTWQMAVNSVYEEIESQFDGVIPNPGAWTTDHQIFFNQLASELNNAYRHYTSASFSTSSVMKGIGRLFERIDYLSALDTHLKGNEVFFDTYRTSVALKVATLKTIATMVNPIAPEYARNIWQFLGLQGTPVWTNTPEFAAGGTQVTPMIRPWFPSLEGHYG